MTTIYTTVNAKSLGTALMTYAQMYYVLTCAMVEEGKSQNEVHEKLTELLSSVPDDTAVEMAQAIFPILMEPDKGDDSDDFTLHMN